MKNLTYEQEDLILEQGREKDKYTRYGMCLECGKYHCTCYE